MKIYNCVSLDVQEMFQSYTLHHSFSVFSQVVTSRILEESPVFQYVLYCYYAKMGRRDKLKSLGININMLLDMLDKQQGNGLYFSAEVGTVGKI